MKITCVFVILMLINTPMYAKIKPCDSEKKILDECELDLNTKTTKGWIRFLQNKSKMETVGIELTKEEVHSLINCLNIKLKQDQLEPIGRMR